MKLSIVIPTYNEARTIGQVVAGVRAVNLETGDQTRMDKEIIVVDDGSTDATGAVLEGMDGDIRVIRHKVNQGKGSAVRTGLSVVTGDIVLIQDADLEYDPAEYPMLLQPIISGRADVVYGSRLSGGRPQRVYLFWHWAGNRLLTLVTNVLFNATLTDMETGYKVFRREVIDSFRCCLRERDFRIEPEITAHVLANRALRVYELPISYYGRSYEEGKKITWRDGFKAMATLIRCRVELK